jgi:putative oxygen-independent coproporphyrinogen III oxidase
MTSLYIHYPFCKKKCPYCDFNSHVRSNVVHDDWQKSYFKEMQYMAEMAQTKPLKSIFFGGGTPSLMPPELVASLIEKAQILFGFAENIEITLEANPTSSESANFKGFKQAGVNRLSIGVQALNAADLAFLGRKHSEAEALQTIEIAAEIFENYSFDLIYARPNQTPQAWEAELRQALKLNPNHLSLYQLTIEPETQFERFYQKGDFELPSSEQANELYQLTETICAEYDLKPYEVSNYAKSNFASQHNLNYWRGGDYIGVGAGAHGRIKNKQGEWLATSTYKSPERWLHHALQSHAIEEIQALTPVERAEEILLCGLRLREGIALPLIRPAINPNKLTLYKSLNLLKINAEQLIVTKKGQPVLEKIARELIL